METFQNYQNKVVKLKWDQCENGTKKNYFACLSWCKATKKSCNESTRYSKKYLIFDPRKGDRENKYTGCPVSR